MPHMRHSSSAISRLNPFENQVYFYEEYKAAHYDLWNWS